MYDLTMRIGMEMTFTYCDSFYNMTSQSPSLVKKFRWYKLDNK